MLLQLLLCLFLNPASAKTKADLEPLHEIKPASTSGDMKAEFNCLSQFRLKNDVKGIPYTGTHDGKSGFYILTNKNLHFYAIDKEAHAACFVKAKTSDDSYNNMYPLKRKRTDVQKGQKDSVEKNSESKDMSVTDAMNDAMDRFGQYQDRYFFNVKTSDEAPYYLQYKIKPTMRVDQPVHDIAYGEVETQSVYASSLPPPGNRAMCTLTDHQALDEESKTDLENLLIERIKGTYAMFEGNAQLNAFGNPYAENSVYGGFGSYGGMGGIGNFDDNSYGETYDKSDTEDNANRKDRLKEFKLNERPPKGLVDQEGRAINRYKYQQAEKVTLPNPQNYINMLESCQNIKSPRVARALELEIAKFKIQKTSTTKSSGGKAVRE